MLIFMLPLVSFSCFGPFIIGLHGFDFFAVGPVLNNLYTDEMLVMSETV